MTKTKRKSITVEILMYNIALTSNVIEKFNKDVKKLIKEFKNKKEHDHLKVLAAKLIAIYNQDEFNVKKQSTDYKIYETNIKTILTILKKQKRA